MAKLVVVFSDIDSRLDQESRVCVFLCRAGNVEFS